MLKPNYELNIISHHPKFNGQALRKHSVDNIDTIGVWGEEPFEIQFKNNTSQRVQVRISLDGTDILTAKPASIQPHGKMWLVNAWDTLSLAAWPEDTEKGARFIFGKTENSVAANTHGDMKNKGIIAAAVFVEGYEPPLRASYPSGFLGDFLERAVPTRARRLDARMDYSLNSKGTKSAKSLSLDSLEEISEGPAVGAGETIQQKIASVQGLRQPVYNGIISLRYLWWDDLKAKLEGQGRVTGHPTGFVDAPLPQKLANLGRTPRIERTYSL